LREKYPDLEEEYLNQFLEEIVFKDKNKLISQEPEEETKQLVQEHGWFETYDMDLSNLVFLAVSMGWDGLYYMIATSESY